MKLNIHQPHRAEAIANRLLGLDPEADKPRLVNAEEVCAMLKRSRSQFFNDVRAGYFPSGIKLGARSVYWVNVEVQAYLNRVFAGDDRTEISQAIVAARKNSLILPALLGRQS